VEVVASLSQGRTAAAQCGLFTYQSVPVIFEPPCILDFAWRGTVLSAHAILYRTETGLVQLKKVVVISI